MAPDIFVHDRQTGSRPSLAGLQTVVQLSSKLEFSRSPNFSLAVARLSLAVPS